MPLYALMMFENQKTAGLADMPPEVLEAHERVPERVAEIGARVVAGLAFHTSDASTTVRGDLVSDGPFLEAKEAVAGITIIEARDLDQAIEAAAFIPIIDGGVEVRPLLGFGVEGQA